MNDKTPSWSAWKTPSPSPHFDQRVWQKLEAARASAAAPVAWWERWAISGALAAAAALLVVSMNLPVAGPAVFTPAPEHSLTRVFATALKGK